MYCPIPHIKKDICHTLSNEKSTGTSVTLTFQGHFSRISFTANVTLRPLSLRYAAVNDVKKLEKQIQSHAVCTVQTFRNPLSGPMLYSFSEYYLSLGYVVIIFDKYGLHRKFVRPFLGHLKFAYHPYTIFNLLFLPVYPLSGNIIQVVLRS